MLTDRMLIGFNTKIDVTNRKPYECAYNLFLDRVRHDYQMDSIKSGELTTSAIINSNRINNNNSNNSIKRERLSPKTNGDVNSFIASSRSVTPSSFAGTSPPQPLHLQDMTGPNLTANILSTGQDKTGDMSARNYSDFMRSLAAKYNNNNNTNELKRVQFFDINKFNNTNITNKECTTTTACASTTTTTEQSDIRHTNTTPFTPNVSPLVSKFLSSIKFSPNAFTPLIDMSSTQALVTLARAAKEVEMQKILKTAQKRPSTSTNASPISHRILSNSSDLQQNLSYNPFMLSASSSSSSSLSPLKLPQQQQTRDFIPTKTSSSLNNENVNTTPLDLSSAQVKRPKLEYTPSPCDVIQNNHHTSNNISNNNNNNNNNNVTTNELPKQSNTDNKEQTKGSNIWYHCQAQSEEINSWVVEDVCNFVGSIDICSEYVQNFRDQCIDGSGLPLLTEDHLTNSLGMKLGPALKLKSILAKKLGGPCPCVSCSTQNHFAAAVSSSSSLNHSNHISNSKKNLQSRPASTDSGS